MIDDDPLIYVCTSRPTDLLTRALECVEYDKTPLEFWKDGKKVAVAINPDHYEALKLIVGVTKDYLKGEA
jgi:hypothetical protein